MSAFILTKSVYKNEVLPVSMLYHEDNFGWNEVVSMCITMQNLDRMKVVSVCISHHVETIVQNEVVPVCISYHAETIGPN